MKKTVIISVVLIWAFLSVSISSFKRKQMKKKYQIHLIEVHNGNEAECTHKEQFNIYDNVVYEMAIN